MNKQTKLIIGGLVIAGVSFFAGAKYDQSKTASLFSTSGFTQNGQRMGSGFGQRGAGMRSFNGAAGTIVSKDATSITLSLRDGSGSKIVFLSASTTIMKTTDGTTGDLIPGKDVSVNGSANSDGSINAQSIQVRPGFATSTPR